MTASAPSERSLHVQLQDRSYPILIGADLLGRDLLAPFLRTASRIALVSNDTVWPLWGARLSARLPAGVPRTTVILPDGEAHKDAAALNCIFDALLGDRCDRDTVIIALGGGVIGDIAGFAAATYLRGVAFIQIPTTLLAQVDSSVGGKTAINHPLGKNMIGAFYQPQLVLADTATLSTLPEREFRSGLAEVIKYGLILDREFFDWLEANLDALLARDAAALAHAIYRSCEIKAQVVAADERETQKDGGRVFLNLGHTFGHAIETGLGYGAWLHGEAVACGCVLAAELSTEVGRLSAAEGARVRAIFSRASLPVELPALSADTLVAHMGRDKKNAGGALRLILLDAIGAAVVDAGVTPAQMHAFLARRPT